MTLGPLMVDIEGTALTAQDRELLAHPAIGGVILFRRNYDSLPQLCELNRQIHAVRRPSLLIGVDQEGGRVQRIVDPLTRLPPVGMIGVHYDTAPKQASELARDCGWLMAAELLASGLDLSFAPVVDVDHGVCEVIGDRAFHRDPHVVAALASQYMAGMHEAGMAATAKHFPGHGCVAADSHVSLPVDRRSMVDINDDLLPYELLIANGLDAVMMALVSYPAIDEQPASFSRPWIRANLREQSGFRGAVFSDDLTMGGAAGIGTMLTRVNTALAAGCDMVLICNDREAVLSVLDPLDQYNDPASQARLASLHRRHHFNWDRLRHSERWKKTRVLLQGQTGS